MGLNLIKALYGVLEVGFGLIIYQTEGIDPNYKSSPRELGFADFPNPNGREQ